jgi:hypothetical protein
MHKTWWKVKCQEVKVPGHCPIQHDKTDSFVLRTLPIKGKIDCLVHLISVDQERVCCVKGRESIKPDYHKEHQVYPSVY